MKSQCLCASVSFLRSSQPASTLHHGLLTWCLNAFVRRCSLGATDYATEARAYQAIEQPGGDTSQYSLHHAGGFKEYVIGQFVCRRRKKQVHQRRRRATEVECISRPGNLTDREIEVLRLMAQGRSNREMATSLGITPKTVGHHVQHIYDKIGVSTRAAAAIFAVENRLLDS